jgi:hypothetical protein
VGTVSELRITNGTSVMRQIAGEYFKVPPVVQLFDAGGNWVQSDSQSAVRISIASNPSDAQLLPLQNLFVQAKNGLVRFHGIQVDRSGFNFTLRFELFRFLGKEFRFVSTDISVLSNRFNVITGPSRQVLISSKASGSWAGNQPFYNQPVIHLADSGNNILVHDYTSTAVVSIVASLSTTKQIVIDTSSVPQTRFSKIFLNQNVGTYGAGQILVITLESPYLLWVLSSDFRNVSSLPHLLLNIKDKRTNFSQSAGFLIEDRAFHIEPTKNLRFKYVVGEYDYLPPADSLLNMDSLLLRNSTIVDGNRNSVNLTIPVDSLNVTIQINTIPPKVVDLTTNVSSGTYGPGDVIDFIVEFDQSVAVSGTPFLLLAVHNFTASIFETAKYDSASDGNKKLHFLYSIPDYAQEMRNLSFPFPNMGNLSLKLPEILCWNSSANESFAQLYNTSLTNFTYNFGHRNVAIHDCWIRRLSDVPKTAVEFNISHMVLNNFDQNYLLRIDYASPAVESLTTTHSAGTYFAGEKMYLYLTFDKPIAIQGSGIELLLDVGILSKEPVALGRAYVTRILADNMTLEFVYSVEMNVNVAAMDVFPGGNSLHIVNSDSFIRRLATHPVQPVNINTNSLDSGTGSLSATTLLTLSTDPPTIESISVISGFPAIHALFPDDGIAIQVKFTSPVTVSCSPVFLLDMGYRRESNYFSGNKSDTYLFHYKILIGDSAPQGIKYATSQNALCPVAGCPKFPRHCGFFANSTFPSLPAFYQTNRSTSIIGNQTVVPLSPERNTTVVDIVVREPPGEYAVGSVFHFDVTFSDIVFFQPRVKTPSLWLNLHRFAAYSSGNHEKVLTFVYTTTANDSSVIPIQAAVYNHTSAIYCHSDCLLNQANQTVNLTMVPSTVFIDSGVTINADSATVTSCIITSPHNYNFSAGEVLQLVVVMSKPVAVIGLSPKIRLQFLNGKTGEALYNSLLSNSTALHFVYQLKPVDELKNFTIVDNRIDLLSGFSQILRLSTIPTTSVNVTIPPSTVRVVHQEKRFTVQEQAFVLEVRTLNATSNYSCGDILYFKVVFSQKVVVLGQVFLQLDVGHGQIRNASYFAFVEHASGHWIHPDVSSFSSRTEELIFQYAVRENDFSVALDYVDATSLILGQTSIHSTAFIKTYPDEMGIDALLDLPPPGSAFSVSRSRLFVDGRAPFLISIEFMNHPGTYSSNSSIFISFIFSKPVVVVDGTPSLLLETGKIKQSAFFQSGSGSKRLIFSYTPEPGDFSPQLDYYTSRKYLNSANGSFSYNGARILGASQYPTVPAIIWLNPPSGNLVGNTKLKSDGGVFAYSDLKLTTRGLDYLLRYDVFPMNESYSLSTFQFVYNSFSSEYQLRPGAALENEEIGRSVDIDGDLAVIGAPNFNLSVTTVQVVSISIENVAPTREVQLISTNVQPQPSIQSFHTTADVEATVGGYFQIEIPGIGRTRNIPAAVDAGTLKSLIQFDLPTIGTVEVTSTHYLFCSCLNAFTWTISFHDQNIGIFPAIILHGDLLTGRGSDISAAAILQYPSRLSGAFTLSALGRESSLIPFDANVAEITSAIEDLGLPVYAVSISMPLITTLARTWSVTFDAYHESYEIPLMTANTTSLGGGLSTSVYVQISQQGYHGPKVIAGYFQLGYRENVTRPLLPNATSAEVKAALEELPSINFVNVERFLISSILHTYSWNIEFVDFNYHNSRGFYREYRQLNAEPLVPSNHLIATNPEVIVASRYKFGDPNLIDSATREGSYGEAAGAVFVYQRVNESWIELATLRGNDTMENNRFGGSVSIDDDIILIGAIGGSMNGIPEKQSLHCSADNGTFRLSFRGWTTNRINFNVTKDELVEAIITPTTVFANLYSVTHITIDDWGSGGLCENNTAVITFYRPVDGAINVVGVDTGSHLELLTIIDNDLTKFGNASAIFKVEEIQAGTWTVHGATADPQQIGSAYIFRLVNTCANPLSQMKCYKNEWRQEAQLFPLLTRQFSQFGQIVVVDGGVAVIGSPGSNEQSGYIYVYEHDQGTQRWPLLQILLDPTVSEGSKFGSAIAKSGNTIVVGAPGYLNSTGGVFVYTRPASGGVFVFAQVLVPPLAVFPLSTAACYGQSVGISANTIAAGAPGYSDSMALFLGSSFPAVAQPNSGAVFLFQRPSSNGLLNFLQKLTPSNVKNDDRFGAALAFDGSTVLVSSLMNSKGNLTSSKAWMRCRSSAAYGHTRLGGYFTLGWRGRNASDHSSQFSTRPIPVDISATKLKYILEEDLQTNKITVTRSFVDVYDGGYEWDITFLRYRRRVESFVPDTSLLTGTNATITCAVMNPTPSKIRSNVHLFQLNFSTLLYDEQLYLAPYRYQQNDLCGYSLSLSHEYAIVGCPNRDQDIPAQNSGTAMIYDLNIMNLKYESSNLSIVEGDDAKIKIIRDSLSSLDNGRDILYYIQTVDRNANLSVQNFFVDRYDLDNDASEEAVFSVLDEIGISGKALARSQSYGSDVRTSRWVDGRYDYFAISDYEQTLQPQVLLSEEIETVLTVATNNDSIVEIPQEAFRMAVSAPGLWPTILGKLYQPVHLRDFSNGFVNGKERFTKLLLPAGQAEANEKFGFVNVFNDAFGSLFVSAPFSTANNVANAGKVLQYNKNNLTWNLEPTSIIKPPMTSTIGGRFGSSLAFSVLKKSSMAILVVGEPLINRVHTYTSYGPSYAFRQFSYEHTFSMAEANTQNHLFGSAVAASAHLLVIGAPGLESVYAYSHYYSINETRWKWTIPKTIRSSDYDYDFKNGIIQLHQQGFGSSIAVSGRTIVVGAPFANYQKLGTALVEDMETEGSDIFGVGKGKVYVFYSQPSRHEICINSIQPLSTGSFRLSYEHYNQNFTSDLIPFNATGYEFQEVLNRLPNMESTVVKSAFRYFNGISNVDLNEAKNVQYCWELIFMSDWLDISGISLHWIYDTSRMTRTPSKLPTQVPTAVPSEIPTLEPTEMPSQSPTEAPSMIPTAFPTAFPTDLPTYSPTAAVTAIPTKVPTVAPTIVCLNCDVFNYPSPNTTIPEMTLRQLSPFKEWRETVGLNALDGRSGDRFGSAVSIHNNLIGVGAPYSSSSTMTTWDFETGVLFGWTKSGTAFDYQPTFGDNPKFRSSIAHEKMEPFQFRAATSNLKGLYYISTFEKHPGDSLNYLIPDSNFPAGNSQGFFPRGVLSSDIFIILGTRISFLIGGGCDIYSVYVELLVDGKSIAKQTGKCREEMELAFFDVSKVKNRAGQIRIVDNSSTSWGFISVDNFHFDWNIQGATLTSSEYHDNLAPIIVGKAESPLSGSAYLFKRVETLNVDKPCPNDSEESCSWVHEAKLLPSDKREQNHFGSAIVVNDERGIAVVSASHAPLTNFYKDTPSNYPYYRSNYNATTYQSTGAGANFPLSPLFQNWFESFPYFAPESSASYGVWNMMAEQQNFPNLLYTSNIGAVYVYTKLFPISSYTGEVATNESWKITEKAKIQPTDGSSGDLFGSSLAFDGELLVIGSPGHHSTASAAGSIYAYRVEFASVKFSQVRFFINLHS